MEYTTLEIPGTDAVRLLNDHRSRYATTGQYPFLIGDAKELQRVKEAESFNEQEPQAIVRASLDINISTWIAEQRKAAGDYEFSQDETFGEWPGEIDDKGSIGLHKDVLTGMVKRTVFLGLARVAEPWQLPAVVKFGGWNACPEPEAHCAFFREWQERYGAEITGISGDIIECAVRKPPADQKTATVLAWEQYWYCPDIVEQGCETVSNLAATLLNSPYWYFWWD